MKPWVYTVLCALAGSLLGTVLGLAIAWAWGLDGCP